MRLDQELVTRSLSESRTEAQELIALGYVTVNGSIVSKQTKQVTSTDVLVVSARRRFVSRGGEKLLGVLREVFGIDEQITGAYTTKSALDIGSSTGGFTDCLLQYGVSHIDAVDVGTSQLHEKLRKDIRVTLFENTDIRNYEPNKEYDIVVVDLSFISLTSILNTILSFGKNGTQFFILIKPQFEVGKGNTKKGIVKDKALVQKLLNAYKDQAFNFGLNEVKVLPCHLTGGDGNQEYFLYGVLQ